MVKKEALRDFEITRFEYLKAQRAFNDAVIKSLRGDRCGLAALDQKREAQVHARDAYYLAVEQLTNALRPSQ